MCYSWYSSLIYMYLYMHVSQVSLFNPFWISLQIATSTSLVSERQDLTILKREYADDDAIYQQKIRVSEPFQYWMNVFGMLCINCYYALIFNLIYLVIHPRAQKAYNVIYTQICSSREILIKQIKLFCQQDLQKKYSSIRKTRPDGNCFYRAFGFSHLESLLEDSKELHR